MYEEKCLYKTFQEQFFNLIVRSYEVVLFLYGPPQSRLLTRNSNRMLMRNKNYQASLSVLPLDKMNSHSIIIG